MSKDKYIHLESEDRIYSYWEKNNLFKPKPNKKKFSIVIPPPNVTGSLHMGHALNNSIQDFLIRYHRMNNYETLWQSGTDHAGIATQALVEKQLGNEGIKKNNLGREKFIEKVWEWKNEVIFTSKSELKVTSINPNNIKKIPIGTNRLNFSLLGFPKKFIILIIFL